MIIGPRLHLKKHFVIAVVVFLILAYPVQTHGLWFQIRFLFFLPAIFLHPIMPPGFFVRHKILSYIDITATMTVAFLYTWLIAYIVARVWAYIRKSQHDT
jgi:hypothetical protein